MENKIALVFCVHHKPWLMMSTLISVLAQDYPDKDIIFLYQHGNGQCPDKASYDEFRKIADNYGENIQLSEYDGRVKDVCKINWDKISEFNFENDHGLDSGAWYKFIRSGSWKKYDYVFFMGEGTILTFDTVISDSLRFIKKHNAHFITGSQDKRRMPKNRFLNYKAWHDKNDKIGLFHDAMIRNGFDIFCRDEDFKRIFDSWKSDFELTTESHVPDKRGFMGSLLQKEEEVVVNAVKRKLKDIVVFQQDGKVKFHKENGPEWFGCCCNHLVSNEFLERFSRKLQKYNIYEVLDLPFSGSSLEVIWGLIPLWLGFDKWFFNGIHRVRKNFITYKREDNPAGMARYLNRYYSPDLKVINDGDFIKLRHLGNKFKYLKEILNSYYF